jgi:8-oxo-dGTP pyrophosphatase MutT (NUDIX family)
MPKRKLTFWQKVIHFFNPVMYPFLHLYWFLTRPRSSGAKVVLTHEDHVLVVEHTYGSGSNMFPGGMIECGEEPDKAALREVEEELGIVLDEVIPLGSFEFEGHYKRDTIHVFHGKAQSREVYPDPFEIRNVFWFPVHDMPQLSPASKTIFDMYQDYAQRTRS